MTNAEALNRAGAALKAAREALIRPSVQALPQLEAQLEAARWALGRFDPRNPEAAELLDRLSELRRQLNEVTVLLAGALEFHRDRVFAVTGDAAYSVSGPLPIEAQAEALRPSHCCDVQG